MRRQLFLCSWLLVLVAAAGACGGGGGGGDAAELPAAASGPFATVGPGVERLAIEVVDTFPHDDGAYTQGLLVDDGVLLESTGQYGESVLREVELRSGEVRREAPLPDDHFGEGLAAVSDRLVQLTWREGVAIVYDRESFEEIERLAYDGEGWGLCHDEPGDRLVMSDGSATLTFRDLDTFAVIGEVEVAAAGEAVEGLNELECVDGAVFANVYRTDQIVVIDPASGQVTAAIDGSVLRDELDGAPRADVLNGIAHDPETGAFYLTGKYWPKLYEVRFVPGRPRG